MYKRQAYIQELIKDEIIASKLLWFPNTSLYQIWDQYHYIEYNNNKKSQREYTIEATINTPYLEKVIEEARAGKTKNKLAELLVEKTISKKDALDFIEQLCNNQILVSSLEPNLTGRDFLSETIINLDSISCTLEQTAILKKIQGTLKNIDNKVGNPIKHYFNLHTFLCLLYTSPSPRD